MTHTTLPSFFFFFFFLTTTPILYHTMPYAHTFTLLAALPTAAALILLVDYGQSQDPDEAQSSRSETPLGILQNPNSYYQAQIGKNHQQGQGW